MKIQKYKKSFSIALVLTLLLVSSIVFSYGNELPITQKPVSQSKNAGLAINKLVVGNLDSPQKLARATSSGWLGLGLPISGSLTNPTVPLDVRGAIRLSELKEPSRQVCASKDGDILDCGFQEFSYGENCTPSTCSQASSIHKFTVPTGVTSITVELWGAGGMGYSTDTPTLYSRSPDSHSTCLQGSNYYCPSGGSSYLYDANGSSTILARAYGGKAPSSDTTGGAGGITEIPPNSKVSTIASASGSNGGVGGNGESSSTSSIYCGSTQRTLRNGGIGGVGGNGGSSGSGGASILGAIGGFFGASANCEIPSAPNTGLPFKGKDGYDGIRGSGGSGASGHGGSAYIDLVSQICHNSNCLSSENGYTGGGGGGYVKVLVTPVTPGQTYTIELSHGGEITNSYVPSTSGLPCDFSTKWTCSQDVKSGKGGPGFARISY